MPILADIAESKTSAAILDELSAVLEEGFRTLQIQKSPHLALLSKKFYDERLLPVI
jgi:hypothetical protein